VKTLTIIPTYNERENLQPLVAGIHKHLADSSILIIDDGSPDGTGLLADQLAQADSRCHVMHRKGKLGLGTASIAGLRWAIAHEYDVAIIVDADLSQGPSRLPAIMAALRKADVAVGSRYVPGGGVEKWSVLRRITSRCVNLLSRTLMGLPINDATGAYRAYRVDKIRAINFDTFISTGYSFQEEMAFRCKLAGCRMLEVPIVFRNRAKGESKVTLNEVVNSFISLFRIAFSRTVAREAR